MGVGPPPIDVVHRRRSGQVQVVAIDLDAERRTDAPPTSRVPPVGGASPASAVTVSARETVPAVVPSSAAPAAGDQPALDHLGHGPGDQADRPPRSRPGPGSPPNRAGDPTGWCGSSAGSDGWRRWSSIGDAAVWSTSHGGSAANRMTSSFCSATEARWSRSGVNMASVWARCSPFSHTSAMVASPSSSKSQPPSGAPVPSGASKRARNHQSSPSSSAVPRSGTPA